MSDGWEDVVVVAPWASGSSARPVGGSWGMVWCLFRRVVCGAAGGARGWWLPRSAVPRHLRSPLWSWWVAVGCGRACVVPFGLVSGRFRRAFVVGVGFTLSCFHTGWAVRELACLAWRVSGLGSGGLRGVRGWCVGRLAWGGTSRAGAHAVVNRDLVGCWSCRWLVFCGQRLFVSYVGALLGRGVPGWAVVGVVAPAGAQWSVVV